MSSKAKEEETEVLDDKSAETGKDKEPDFMTELDVVLDRQVKESQSESNAPDDGVSEGKAPEKKSDSKSEPAGKDKESDPDDQGETKQKVDKGGEKLPVVDEALLERAVRAGMTLADAKAISSGDALGRIVGRLEETAAAAAKKTESDGSGSGDEDASSEAKDPLADIPDLDPEEYDEKLVKTFSALKALAGQQGKTIKELSDQLAASVDARQGSWIDGEIAKLGKEYVDVFGEGNLAELPAGEQKLAREKLLRHLEFAESDAKAEGKTLTKSAAFEGALKSAFGDKVKSTKGAAAAEAAAKRSQQSVNRPRDTTGRFASDADADHGTDEDREADAVKAIEAMMEDGE